MNPDDHLDQLFQSARQQQSEPPSEYGFETRLLATLREAQKPQSLLGVFAWRLLPGFAAITLSVAIYTAKTAPATDPTGSFLGENALVELLAD